MADPTSAPDEVHIFNVGTPDRPAYYLTLGEGPQSPRREAVPPGEAPTPMRFSAAAWAALESAFATEPSR